MSKHNKFLCDTYLCTSKFHFFNSMHITVTIVNELEHSCNGVLNCRNTDLDEVGCSHGAEISTLPSGKEVFADEICNGVCHDVFCEDEANCDGYLYGMYCGGNDAEKTSKYIPVFEICNGNKDCNDGSDEKYCNVEHSVLKICRSYWGSMLRPVHNFTRCYTIKKNVNWNHNNFRYCENYVCDQTNCTDPEKVGAVCKIKGYNSTISKQMICDGEKLCDDGIEDCCLGISDNNVSDV